MSAGPLLAIEGLHVDFAGRDATLHAVDGVDLAVDAGEVVGVVGESGSGKSVTALAIMGLIDAPGQVSARRMTFAGHELTGNDRAARARRGALGGAMAMIFQDPLASLDPCYTVGYQIDEVLRVHGNDDERQRAEVRRARIVQLLQQVEIPDAPARVRAWPHQLSGGMAQRVMIAMALASRPTLLIADEPTTALDVTVQAQVLALLRRLQRDTGMALLLITHDLALVAGIAQRVVVMYAGQVMETGAVPGLFAAPHHPYTQALLDALPEHNADGARLAALPGRVPGAHNRPAGCLFAPRCVYRQPVCTAGRPPLARLADDESRESVRCLFPLHAAARVLPAP